MTPTPAVLMEKKHDHASNLMLSREGDWDGHAVPAYAERDFRRCLECGILAYGFPCLLRGLRS